MEAEVATRAGGQKYSDRSLVCKYEDEDGQDMRTEKQKKWEKYQDTFFSQTQSSLFSGEAK